VSGLVETAPGPPEGKGKKRKRSLVRIELPGDNSKVLDVAEATAEALKGRNVFFRRGDAVVYPSPTGEAKMLPMTPIVFRSAIEEYVEYFKFRTDDDSGETYTVQRSLNKSDAETILASRLFWPSLPEIKRVHPCPLPVLRTNGKVEMLEPGYDAESGIYTFAE
jgi:hypothetical protein